MRSPRRPPSPPAKIADVARLAGVSVATVSRALATPEVVSETTRERVLAAVRETGYTPNIAARNLRARKSMMVLVVVPDISNSFFADVLRGIDEALAAENYGLIIANLGRAPEQEARYVNLALAGQVDGVLLLCGHVPCGGGRRMTDANLPIVAACETIPGADFPQVEVDNRAAAKTAVQHLIGLGHRRIAYLSGPRANVLDQARAAGYAEALAEAGLTGLAPVLDGDFGFHAGTKAAETLAALPAETRPTALFAANDEMAIGFIKAARGLGLAVPDDMSVIGFDGIDYADFCEPTLATIHQPRRTLGARAADLLIGLMSGRDKPHAGIERVATELRARASAAPLAAR
ncbi:LacI family DNA-binding transcriptional regulator [Elstera cyanobacteriorum]|uniref:LacI family DNA-binding transcriptional regulator n=1 Tax=Elstera cyanobacteriorum TaxID=2022747 RepID=UPI00235373A5|nr:LacI family DNA-binding transcriptional regulator [Elstera cyanobacteriorum]MCK6441620.1 LacI family transcriptional regulator [Elstera cyanobacteriorum]